MNDCKFDDVLFGFMTSLKDTISNWKTDISLFVGSEAGWSLLFTSGLSGFVFIKWRLKHQVFFEPFFIPLFRCLHDCGEIEYQHLNS